MIGPAAKIVARYVDGKLVKGYTYDFAPGRRRFHVFASRDAAGVPTPILLHELKAVFCVRDFLGNARYRERKQFADGDGRPGRRLEVMFRDGEVLTGYTTDDIYAGPGVHAHPGVFFVPADSASNNVGVYAVSAAVRRYRYLTTPERRARQTVQAPPSGPPLPARILAWLVTPVALPRPRLLQRAR